VEDAVRQRLIQIDALFNDGRKREQFLRSARERLRKTEAELATALNILVLGAPHLLRPYNDDIEQRGALRRLTTLLHDRYILAVHRSDQRLRLDERYYTELKVLKHLMHYFVFDALAEKQNTVPRPMIAKLFGYYLTSACSTPERLPVAARWAFEETGRDHNARVRAAADAVAGLTEAEAEAEGIAAGAAATC
jgi:hypothetical protein